MKIRQGHVSNSSSSSFIVTDEREIARILREQLLADRKKKLNNLNKILNIEEEVVSLHEEIINNYK